MPKNVPENPQNQEWTTSSGTNWTKTQKVKGEATGKTPAETSKNQLKKYNSGVPGCSGPMGGLNTSH
jgi:hypothetical protein